MRVLGIDPGLTRCGLGAVEGGRGRKVDLVAVDVIRTPAGADLPERLLGIAETLEGWLDRLRPDVVAVERVFSQHNVRTVMGTAQAAGVAVLAASGGRLDHTLGNVALIASYPGRVVILDGASTLLAIDRLAGCCLAGPPGTILSLIPYGTRVAGVRTTGLKYPLQGQDLAVGTRGISNQLLEATARVEIGDGILLVYLERGEVT